MQALGPAPPPGWQGPSEHLPLNEAAVLRGHEGPVLVVRFNPKGTYCLSGGKVRRLGWLACLLRSGLSTLLSPLGNPVKLTLRRTAPSGCGTRTAASRSRPTPGTATTCGALP